MNIVYSTIGCVRTYPKVRLNFAKNENVSYLDLLNSSQLEQINQNLKMFN